MAQADYKLFEDEHGVRHWRYRFSGLLLVCGAGRSRGGDVNSRDGEVHPTCLTCVVIMAREEGW